ncbi:hypothetical protein A2U01_0061223, partial [Trifolium medium]|nr:hypothetical protein [Trifolium medium]
CSGGGRLKCWWRGKLRRMDGVHLKLMVQIRSKRDAVVFCVMRTAIG